MIKLMSEKQLPDSKGRILQSVQSLYSSSLIAHLYNTVRNIKHVANSAESIEAVAASRVIVYERNLQNLAKGESWSMLGSEF